MMKRVIRNRKLIGLLVLISLFTTIVIPVLRTSNVLAANGSVTIPARVQPLGYAALEAPKAGISNIAVTGLRSDQATIMWQTDKLDARQYLESGSTDKYGHSNQGNVGQGVVQGKAIQSVQLANGGWQHQATFQPANGVNHFRIVASGSASADQTFTSVAPVAKTLSVTSKTTADTKVKANDTAPSSWCRVPAAAGPDGTDWAQNPPPGGVKRFPIYMSGDVWVTEDPADIKDHDRDETHLGKGVWVPYHKDIQEIGGDAYYQPQNPSQCTDHGTPPTPPPAPPDGNKPFGPNHDCGAPAVTPGSGCGPHIGDPVELGSLTYTKDIPLLGLGGHGLPVNFVLIYRSSSLPIDYNLAPAVSSGWSYSYLRRLTIDSTTGNTSLCLEDGRCFAYGVPATTGAYTTPANSLATLTRSGTAPAFVYTLTYRDGTFDQFDSTGTLQKVQDLFNNQTLFTYTAGKLTTITNAQTSQQIVLGYGTTGSSNGLLTTVSDGPNNGATARTVKIGYNPAGQLATVTDPAGNVANTFTYNAAGYVEKIYDANNDPANPKNTTPKFTQNVYDADGSGRIMQQILPNNTTIDFNSTVDTSNSAGPVTLNVVYNNGKSDARTVQYIQDLNGYILQQYVPNSKAAYTQNIYNANGQLQSTLSYPSNHNIEYIYNANGDLTEIHVHKDARACAIVASGSPNCDITVMDYDGFGNMKSQIEPAGAATTWGYSATTGALQTMTRSATIGGQPINQVTSYTINTYGQPYKITEPDGTIIQQDYDTLGYPSVTTYDIGDATHLNLTNKTAYDTHGWVRSSTDMQGVNTTYEYDGSAPATGGTNGWPSASVLDNPGTGAGQQIRTEYSYDAAGNVKKVVKDVGPNRLNATTTLNYDFTGTNGGYAQTSVTTQDTTSHTQTTSYTYTTYGDIQTVTGPPTPSNSTGEATTYNYTPEGWLYTVKLNDQRTAVTNYYYPSGLLKDRLDARGTRTSYTYDTKERVATVTYGSIAVGNYPAINASYTYGYDANDRLQLISDPVGHALTTNLYDGFDRLASVTNGANNVTNYTYDDTVVNGLPATGRNWLRMVAVGSDNPNQQVQTLYDYDKLGRLAKMVVDPGNARKNLTTLYGYTLSGSSDRYHLQQVTDPNLNVTQTLYNTQGLVAQLTDANTKVWKYQYDHQGFLTQTLDPFATATRATNYGIDLLGRKTSLSRNGQTESWRYNADNTLDTHTDFAGQVTKYGYDTTRRMTSVTYGYSATHQGPDTTGPDATYAYFDNNLLSTVNDSLGTTSYTYDAFNRLSTRTRDSRTISYTYNTNSTLAKMTYWNQGDVGYSYDGADRVNGVAPWNSTSSTVTDSYQSTGQIADQSRTNGTTTHYGYDTADRLTGVTHKNGAAVINDIQYTLDNNGNRKTMTDATGTTSYVYDPLNRMTQAALPAITGGSAAKTINTSYDAAGNPTTINGQTVSYNDSDQLSITGASYDLNGNLKSDPFTGTTYTYDAANRLIKTTKNNVDTTYGYDGLGNLVREVTGGVTHDLVLDESQNNSTVLGDVSSDGSSVLYAYGPEGVTAQERTTASTTPTVNYSMLDGLGSVRNVTNAAGALVKSLAYDPQGNVRYQNGTEPTTLGFTGERTSADGTVNLRARVYQPGLGLFLQRDTFGGFTDDPQSLNRYSYAENNPTNLTDHNGHFVWLIPIAVGVGLSFIPSLIAPPKTAIDTVDPATRQRECLGAKNYDKFKNIVDEAALLASVIAPARAAPEAIDAAASFAADAAADEAGAGLAKTLGGCSFTTDTSVETNQGKKPIGSLRVGDKVLAYNPKTKKDELQPITHVWINHDNDLVDLTISSDTSSQIANLGKYQQADKKQTSEVVHTNEKHPFLTKEHGFLPVSEIKLGMHLLQADGQMGIVMAKTSVSGEMTMYNLEVANDHTFTVGDGEWIVHNTCGPEGSFNKLKPHQLNELGIDAHQFKRGFFGDSAKVSHYDIYKDSNGNLFFVPKNGTKGDAIHSDYNVSDFGGE